VLHVEPAVSGPQAAAVLTRGGGRVSHSHGISLTARRRTLPGFAVTRRGAVSLVPASMAREGRPA
jgi:hypothetical protein